jgi:hypothetical protein
MVRGGRIGRHGVGHQREASATWELGENRVHSAAVAKGGGDAGHFKLAPSSPCQ